MTPNKFVTIIGLTPKMMFWQTGQRSGSVCQTFSSRLETGGCRLEAGLYRWRWQIEKVFDCLKNKLNEKKSWAASPTAKAAHRTVGQAKVGNRASWALVAQHVGYARKARTILRQTHPVVAVQHPIRTCLDRRLAPPASPLCDFMKPILSHRSVLLSRRRTGI